MAREAVVCACTWAPISGPLALQCSCQRAKHGSVSKRRGSEVGYSFHMHELRRFAAALVVLFFLSLPAVASPLVTGNGFGFAVVSPTDATVTKFYAHPYSFARPDPRDDLS